MRSTLRNACIFAAMLLLFAFSATAQNRQQALNLTLLTTSMQTADDTLALTNTYAHVFGTLDVTCPSTATNGCTIEIQVSSQFAYASGANPDTINIGVSGATLPPWTLTTQLWSTVLPVAATTALGTLSVFSGCRGVCPLGKL